MEIKIEKTIENKLLDRKELEVFVHFDGTTPPRAEIKSTICAKIAANPELVVLRNVANEFGLKRVKVSVHVYEKAETLKTNEPEYIHKREGMDKPKEEPKPAAAKEEKAPVAPKEEKPAPAKEEKKEEPKPKEVPKESPKKEEKPPEIKEDKPAEPKKKEAPKE
jgi:ribosomal protein S24E